MFREIGYSNPRRWDFEMARNMERLMSTKYNRLFSLLEVDYNPLHNIDLTETETQTRELERKNNQDTTRNGDTDAKHKIESTNGYDGSTTSNTSVDGTTTATNELSGSSVTDTDVNATANTSSTAESTTQSTSNANSTTTSDNGAVTMPDDITSTEEYYNDRVHAKGASTSDSTSNSTTNSTNTTDETSTNSTNSSVTNTETTDSTTHDLNTTATTEDTNSTTTLNSNSTNNTKTTETEKLKADENVIEKFTHEVVTKGSSAGLSFANAMMQQKKLVEETMLLDELFFDLEPLFYSLWGNDINFD